MSALLDSLLRGDTERLADIVRNDQAAREADAHYMQLKDSGELERRRVEHAGRSFDEKQFDRDHTR